MNVFGIGLPEMAVIAAVALLVFGPKRLPEFGRTLGKTLKGFQSASKEFEREINKAMADPEPVADQAKAVDQATVLEASVEAAVTPAVAPKSEPTPPPIDLMNRGDLRLVVGLGNPGNRYANTRHNVGFMALERLVSREGGAFRSTPKLQGQLADLGSGERRLRLLMPQTFMNDSGRSIRAALDWFGFELHQLLVLVDDMDLPLGRLRLRARGSAGGHNGLKSTIQHLGTQDFARLRIGIGAPGQNPSERKARTVSHVLGSFSREEEPLLDKVLVEVVDGLERIQRQGLDLAGNHINGLQLAPTNPEA